MDASAGRDSTDKRLTVAMSDLRREKKIWNGLAQTDQDDVGIDPVSDQARDA